MKNYLEYLESIQTPKNFQRKVEYLKYNFSKYFNQKEISVLEVGPGLGEFVHFLNQKGIKTIDLIDQDKDILQNIKQKYLVRKIFLGDISSIQIKDKYDVIFLLQVLEHIPKTKYHELLNTLYKQLNKDGKIIITVPNGNNPFSLTERYSDLTHQMLFTENSLKELPNYCNLSKTTNLDIQPYNIPPYSLINIIRIILQKIIHIFIFLGLVLNGGVYSQLLTPNITLIIAKNK